MNSTVSLDGKTFINCTFTGCKLTYAGGTPPVLKGCTFTGTQFTFTGAAKNTATFLHLLATPASGMRAMVEEILGVKFK